MKRSHLCLAAIFLLAFRLCAAQPLRVAVTSDSPEISDLVAAELSHDANLAVIERSQVELLLREGALDQAFASSDTRARLGRLLGMEAFIHVRAVRQGEWRIEVVHAASGKMLASGAWRGDPAQLADSARKLLKTAQLPKKEGRSRIAVIDFTAPDEKENVENRSTALRLAAELRVRLDENGLDVLDRLASAQVSNEQALDENGFLESVKKLPPMLGADFVIAGKWSAAGKNLRLSILNLGEGRLAAEKAFDLSTAGSAAVTEQVMKWIFEHVAGKAVSEQFAWTPSVQAEALVPFYRGVTMFQQGQVLEATAEFEKAYTLSDKFEEASLWEARCYEVAGLQPLADAMRFYVDRRTVGYGVSAPISAAPVDGLTFLGVADGKGDGAVCQKLEILTTDAMTGTSQRILLPSNLAHLRDEYDVLVGVKNSRGVTWDEAPGFLTRQTLSGVLTKSEENAVLQLKINDTLRGNLLASEEIALTKESEAWNEQIAKAVKRLLSRSSVSAVAQTIQPVALPSTEEIKSKSGRDGNVGILRLALKDPASLAADWRPLQKPTYELPKFLNFGLREFLLNRIPADHPNRPWMELERITRFLPFSPEARYFTAHVLDPIAELERFVKSHPDDLPGAVAEYMLLWETMARVPYAELEKRFAAVDEKLRRFVNDRSVVDLNRMAQMPDHMRQLAIIAQDDPARRIPLPRNNFPHRMIPKVGTGGRISMEETSPWMASEWQYFDVSPEDAVYEARAAFAFLGRGNNRFKVNPQWMHDFPHSHVLTCFVIEAIRNADLDDGLPLFYTFDTQAERHAYREMVSYAYAEVRREIHNVHRPEELDRIENYEVRHLLTDLTHPGFRLTVPDTEFDQMREAFANDVAEAERRIGRTQRHGYDEEWLDWHKITRAISPFSDQKYWRSNQGEIYDPQYLKDTANRAARESAAIPVLSSPWYRRMRQYVYVSLSPEVRADYYMEQLPKLLKDYANSDLSNAEMEQTLQFAFTLLGGRKYAEAEELFRKVYETPESDVNRTHTSADLRANAACQLGTLAIHFGRKSEAVRLLRQVLEMGDGHPIKLVEDGGWHAEHFVSVQTLALWLLSELREETLGLASNGALHKVIVKQPGYFPGDVPFYFRVPAGFDPKSGKKYRVLLLVPSVNSGGSEYCRDENTWARFADAHDLFLVAPKFLVFWNDFTVAQESACKATLQALAKIREQYPIETDKLLLHGYGFGAPFVERLALWKPELCAAVSAHSASYWVWEEALQAGLHPLSDLKSVPFLVTSGEDDDAYAPSIRFATFARSAGVPLIWKSLPHTPHRPTPEMETLAQTFLAAALDGSEKKEHFTGDLRTWKFFPAVDKRVSAIPVQYRQKLPSRAVAELWGREQTP